MRVARADVGSLRVCALDAPRADVRQLGLDGG